MTVETATAKVTANGNDVATTFSFSPIVLPASDDLEVTHVDADGVETVLPEGTGASAYAVVVTTFPGTGSITYPEDEVTPLPTGESVIMKRLLTHEQQTDLENQGGYFADVLEAQLDLFAMMDIQLQEELDRSFKIKIADTTLTDPEIPNAGEDGTAGDVLALNSGKTAFEYVTPNTGSHLTLPTSSTDNGIARFSGTAGKTFENSGITIDDNNIMQHAAQTRWVKGADIASASPLVLGTDGNLFDVTGTTGFTSITVAAGILFTLQFDGALTLTHSATLIMPHAANQTTQAGDRMLCISEAANTTRVIAYTHATAAAARTDISAQAQGDVLDDLNTLGANAADSEFLVGTGAGALAWESGATAIASLGIITATTSAEGLVERSTSAENVTGTDDTVYPTVAGTKEMIDTHAGTPTLSSLGIANHDDIVVSASGEMTNGTQPVFLVTPSGTLSNVTGDDTVYTIVWASEVFDIGGSFSSTTFTAPITGKYYLFATVSVSGLTSSHTRIISGITVSNQTVSGYRNGCWSMADQAAGHIIYGMGGFVDMDTSDTATTYIRITNGTKVADVHAGSGNSFFGGVLVT